MDNSEVAKAVLPFVGGLMALVGGAFTFINGRLKEAETAKARDRVWTSTLQVLAIVFNLGGVLVFVLGHFSYPPLLSLTLFTAAFVVENILFLRRSGSLNRPEMVSFSLLCCTYTGAVILGVSFHLFDRVIDLMGRMQGEIGDLFRVVETLAKH